MPHILMIKMQKTNLTYLVTVALAVMAITGCAQAQSPPAHATVSINGKTISIDYSAPSVRGRKIFGGLLADGSVWRTGANSATTLKTDANLDLNGLKVPAGTYTMYTLLDPGAWQLIINKQTGQWGTEYDQSKDLGRVKMNMSKPPAPVETFVITLNGTGGKKGTLSLAWENTVATVPFTVQ